jgi:zinc transporter, ZIP family
MLSALLVGLAASSALVIGANVGAFWKPPGKLVAAAMAFASGALITALAFDLFEEAFKTAGAWLSGTGLLAGAIVFVVVDRLLDVEAPAGPQYASLAFDGFSAISGHLRIAIRKLTEPLLKLGTAVLH